MENASRALMMAAGVLIGLMILSLAVYLITSFGSASAEAHKTNEQNRINEFNTRFTQYEGREDITIHDVATVVNLARSNNEEYGLTSSANSENTLYIEVFLEGASIEQPNAKNNIEQLIQDDIDSIQGTTDKKLPTYNCRVEINPNTQRVNRVYFTKNK